MLNVLAVIFVFSFLVIIHELGHFLAARWMGVRVEKFSIGFPPTIYSRMIGDTKFSISAIPLGGYVKMAGFIDESMDTKETGQPYEFSSKPVWRRVVIIIAGVIMNLILAITVMGILNYAEGEKIIPSTQISVVGMGGVAEKVGFQKNDRILAINEAEVRNWNEIQSRFIDNLNCDIIFKVERQHQILNLIYRKEWFKSERGEQLDIAPLFSTKVGDVTLSMPAGKIGLQIGDEILTVAGAPVHNWQEMTAAIRSYPEKETELTWRRDGQMMIAKIIPQKFEEKNEQGETQFVGKIGVSYYYEHREIGVFAAIGNGFENTYDLIVLNVRSLYWVITGTKSAKEIIGGPIMIAKMAGDAAQAGWTYLWYLIAALSAMLAFFNILPIPALDGGHLVFLIIESILGKPLPVKTRLKIQQVGMAILFTLILLIFYVDIKRLFF